MPGAQHIEQNLPRWLQDMYQRLGERSEAIRMAEPTRYDRSQHRIAPFNEDILRAHQMGREHTGSYAPYLRKSEEMTRSGTRSFPEDAQKYINPYINNVVSRIGEEGGRTFKEQILPGLEAHFVKLGQHGSSRHAQMGKQAARDLQNEIMAKQNQALASGYQQAAQMYNADMTRALEGARDMASLGGLNQAGNTVDMGSLMEQGRYQQAQQQAMEDLRHQEFLRAQEAPYTQLAQQAGILSGMPIAPSQSYLQQPAMPPAQMNMWGNASNAALGALGMSRLMGGHYRGGYIRGY